MTWDIAVVAAYLLVTLLVGMTTGRGVTTMKQYVIGKRKRYTTFTLVATLLVTDMGGGSTLGASEKVFSLGLVWMLAALGESMNKLATAYWVAPRMQPFQHKLSVGEIMGELYDKPGQVITGVSGALMCLGLVGAQMVGMGHVLQSAFGLSHAYATALTCGIVVAYASFGGIRAVTATDVIQFVAFIIVVPILAGLALWNCGGYNALHSLVPHQHFAVVSRPDMFRHGFVFLVLAIPVLDPSVMQRLLMAENGQQARTCLNVTAVVQAALTCLITLIALATLATSPQLDPSLTLLHAVNTLLHTGLRGLGIVALLAVMMSTADSCLHAAAVSLSHDTIAPLQNNLLSDAAQLKLTRWLTFALGIAATGAAMHFTSIVDLFLASYDFWAPVVVPPLLLGIGGYKASARCFCAAATAGVAAVWTWNIYFADTTGIDATVPGLLVNGLTFVLYRGLMSR
ncbi:MAG: sodium:solute symporter family protein [Myxococcota bacterium]